ncbi:hypothetical protein [Lentilactobacillus kefiri]|uniref:Uncharacterized protein n=2 Tax=Lentilactobacillus kefiri TaxID=33962 RepID=A0A511DZH9_LENKE|nr:hypothetical protein [Lentilactobacillus kefiri]MCJ2161954.1 hypothetical protein [Lentilactobacillus kefiri]MCP9369064.1 hypothetical protein [Lentilactobacillus kefiri]MDH5109563.1 hypothetical protein [Lentilactobacillus kefiri]MDM7493827.1 hypothetical protein [Lentilactobacillus kefiri]PAK59473.1 hypothetical protein B9K02_05835 [Lentilactobacillus kefiri]
MLNYNRSTLIQSGLRVIGMLLIWMMFTNISLKMFFINPRLLHLTLIGLVFAILLNEISRPQKNLIIVAGADVVLGILLASLYLDMPTVNVWLILVDFVLANLLLISNFIDEPHCRWIIFGFISGTGLVLLFTTSYHHYFSLVSLMYITLMVFANIFFSYYAFMKKNNQLSMIIISVLILMLCLTLSISFLKIILITVILAFYVYFESRVNFRNHEKRANVSAISFLLFSFLICF